MKLSIVTICLNDAEHLDRCLKAIGVLDARGWEIEVIVSDGGSTDNSLEVASAQGAQVVHSNPGIPVQRNSGTRVATGDVIAHVDCDVELFQGFMDCVDEYYADGRELLLGGIKRLPADAHWVVRADTLAWMGAASFDDTGRADMASRSIAGYCIIANRSVYDRVVFREDMPVGEDTMFVYDAEHLGIPIVVDPRVRYVHHGEPADFSAYVKKLIWNHNYSVWLRHLAKWDRAAWRSMNYWWGLLFTAGLIPAGVPAAGMVATRAAVTAIKNGTPQWLPQLVAMYAGSGFACTAALLGYGRDKQKRWRK